MLTSRLTAGNLAKAQTAMKVLFDSDISSLSAEAVEAAFEGDPRLFIAPRAELLDVALPRLIASAKHARSKSKPGWANGIRSPDI